MAYSNSGLNDLYAKLSLEDEDDGMLIVENAGNDQIKDSFVLIGRFLTERNINFRAMQNVLSAVWRPKEGVEIHDLGDMRYSFVFYHPMDVQKVIDGGPWSFEQGMLVFKQLTGGEDPKEITLDEVDIWIQVYDIPKGLVSESILKGIASYVGQFIKSDPANLNGLWKAYYRLRVRIDVCKPLKRRMKIKREGGDWSWVHFKYERLSAFCFVCGRIGHAERDCNVVYANPGKEIERTYGTWLRAPNKNTKNENTSRWLRNGEGGSNWGGSSANPSTPATGNGSEEGKAKYQEDGRLVVTTLEDNLRDKGEILGTFKGNTEIPNQYNQNSKNVFEGNTIGPDNLFVVDPKRRRTNLDQNDAEAKTQEQITDMDTQDGLMQLSKNELMAGTAMQTRQSL